MLPTQNLISIQDEYTQTVLSGMVRWAHRKKGGHMARISRGARRKAESKLSRLGFTAAQVSIAIHDARDMALLEFNALEFNAE